MLKYKTETKSLPEGTQRDLDTEKAITQNHKGLNRPQQTDTIRP